MIKPVDDTTRGERLRTHLKKAVFATAFLLVSPLIVIAWIEKRVSRNRVDRKTGFEK